MLGDFVGDYGGRLVIAVGGVGLALVVLVGVLWLLRNRAPSPFVRGGKNRQPRLQVLDAAAVDARRRLVLVRRDGVEHLIMIGGPTDIVIESGIGDSSKPAALPQPVALEALPPSEPRPSPRLEAPREPPRVIARKPDAEQQLPPPPPRSVIEPPAERRPPAPAVVTVPPAMAAVPVAAAAVKPAPAVERREPQAQPPAPIAAIPASEPPVAPLERKQVSEAVDVLEAARQRVLPVQTEPEQAPKNVEPEKPVAAPPQAPVLIQDAYHEASIESAVIDPPDVPSIAPPKQLGSDFESILEVEMSNNLRAERVVPQPQPLAPPRPVTSERQNQPTGIVGDAALQSEVARIFGEINVKGEK